MKSPNYTSIAAGYDARYAANPLSGIKGALLDVAARVCATRVLEIGCGTGHWLAELKPVVAELHGVDPSQEMLSKARQRDATLKLTCGRDTDLRFPDAFFDMVFCVNAIHHFDAPERFARTAYRLLRPGGAIAFVGCDPRECVNWIYDYFEGTRETDLDRFPRKSDIAGWMRAVGFENVSASEAGRVVDITRGREVLSSPFLPKGSCSQLALLTEEAYAAGVERIKEAIVRAEQRGDVLAFRTDIPLQIATGRRPI